MRLFTLLLFLSLFDVSAALAADDIELTADKQVEWHQQEQKIVAVGNAVVTKKDLKVRADTMTADYVKDSTGKTQINKVHAQGNVKMHSARADGFGHTLDYNLAQDSMLLQGKPAKIKTAAETITAEDGITYYPNQRKAVAVGNVKADNGKDKLFSDKMIAYFEPKSATDTSLEMNKVEIFGHVKIITANATVWSDRGLYLPKDGIVELYDNVTIDQQGNKLHGDYAQTDLNTNISRIMAGKTPGKRVTGTFKEKSKDQKSKPQAAEHK